MKSQVYKARPIICKFHFFGDRQEVWSKRSQLKGSDFIMQEDFSQEINAMRSQLAPIMFAARKLDMKSFLAADKHIINGQSYTVDTLKYLSDSLDVPKLGTTKVTNNITAFYGSLTPLSNYHPAKFHVNDVAYKSSEQYLHHKKAVFFSDSMSAAKIMAGSTPAECKKLGEKVDNFDFSKWKDHCKAIMKSVCWLNFHKMYTALKHWRQQMIQF